MSGEHDRAASATCPRCGSPVPAGDDTVCLACIGAWALRTDDGPAASHAAEIAVPGRLGDFELIEELGRGGMGVVYAARQPGLNRIVALKVLAGGALATTEAQSRFEREAETIARLHHPNIVTVHAAGRAGGLSYYAMDFVDGLDLARACAEDPIEPREAARIVAAVARAVHHAHEAGIVHRDLKASNVLLDASDAPRVVDFGVARWAHEPADLTRTGQILGSPAYMAPEQAAGRSSPAVDIHALGGLLFFTLTGRPPFEGQGALEVLARVVTEPARAPGSIRAGVPPALDAVTLRCLAKQPGDRYATALEVAEDLERWLAGTSVKTHYTPAAEAARLVAEVQRRLWVEGYNWDVIPDCIALLTRALEIAPDHAVAHAELSRLHAAMASGGMDSTPARRELARIALERAEALDPGHPQVRAARAAHLQWLDRDAPAAARIIAGVLRDHPGDGRSWSISAQLAMMENRWATAHAHFGRAAGIEPASAQARFLMARTCFFLRDYASASTWMQEAARLDPKPLHRRLHAIWFHWHADPEPERALARMRALPDEERFRREAAWCECQMLVTLRRFDEALALYERAAPEAGQGADIKSGYSIDETAYLLRLKRWAGSERRFETEKRLRAMLDPARAPAGESASSMMNRAFAWATAGDHERAHAFMARALAARPWPAWAADAARLAGTNEFYFPAGQLTVLALLGEADRFFAELERWLNVPAAVNTRQLATDPLFDAMRADPRYERILATSQTPIVVDDSRPAESASLAEAGRLVAEVRAQAGREGYQFHLVQGFAEKLSRAAELAPDLADAHAELALLHATMVSLNIDASQARRDLARQAVERAEAADPRSPHTRCARAIYIFNAEGRSEPAAPMLAALSRELPDDVRFQGIYSRACVKLGRWSEAKIALQRRISRLETDSPAPRQLLAAVHCHLREYSDAVVWIEEALRVDAGPAYRRLFRLWFRWLADPEPARALRELHALPEAERKARTGAWCEAQFLLALQRHDEAFAVYRASAATPEGWTTQAAEDTAHLLRLARWAHAPEAAEIEAALRQQFAPGRARKPGSPKESLQHAYALATLGRRDEALALADAAVEASPPSQDAVESARNAGANEFYTAPGRLIILAILDERDRFFGELERLLNVPAAIDPRYLAMDPSFQSLRQDPRWDPTLSRLQIPIPSPESD